MVKLQEGLAELAAPAYISAMAETAPAIVSCMQCRGKALFCGNGGSAADAQHLAAELVGRQNYDHAPAADVARGVDKLVLAALANDYGYDTVFARQVQAIGREGDVLVGLLDFGSVAKRRTGPARHAHRRHPDGSFHGQGTSRHGDCRPRASRACG